MNEEILPNVKEQQDQAARSSGQLQDKLGQCPHQQGVRTVVPMQGELRGSADVNQGQPRVPWFPDTSTMTGQLRGTKSGSPVMQSQDQRGAWPSCSVVQTRTKAEAWAKCGSQARGGSPQQGFSQLFLPKLAAFAAAWPNVTCLCHISQNPRVGEEVAELGGALRAPTSRWKWN